MHFNEFLLALKGYDRKYISYNLPLKVSDLKKLTSDPNVQYLLSLDFANIRLSSRFSTVTTKNLQFSIFALLGYVGYLIINFPRSSFLKCLQSSFLILFILLKIILSKIKIIDDNLSIIEFSRFNDDLKIHQNKIKKIFIPASFKVLSINFFNFLIKKWTFPSKGNLHNKNKISCINTSIILKASICLVRNKICNPFTFIPLFIIRSFLLRALENKLLTIDTSKINFITIGTVEPWQKLFSTHILAGGGNVNLLQHGIIYDSIGEFQIFNNIETRDNYPVQIKLDINHLKLFKIIYNVSNLNLFKKNYNIKKLNNENYIASEISISFPKDPQNILVFSSSYIQGMGFQSPFSLIYLLQFIRFKFHPDTKITIRLHPGDSMLCFLYLIFITRIPLSLIKFDDENNKKFDYTFGLPSTYYIKAMMRTNYYCILFAPKSKYRINFNPDKWIY